MLNNQTAVSLFSKTPTYVIDGSMQYGLLVQQVFPSYDDTFISVSQRYVNRWDMLAYDYYGDARLWWVIPQVSAVANPCYGPALGQILRVPSKTRLMKEIQ